jgi:hypothetical protein
MTERTTLANKNYISIGVSVRTTKPVTHNNGGGVRLERDLQSPFNYESFTQINRQAISKIDEKER